MRDKTQEADMLSASDREFSYPIKSLHLTTLGCVLHRLCHREGESDFSLTEE